MSTSGISPMTTIESGEECRNTRITCSLHFHMRVDESKDCTVIMCLKTKFSWVANHTRGPVKYRKTSNSNPVKSIPHYKHARSRVFTCATEGAATEITAQHSTTHPIAQTFFPRPSGPNQDIWEITAIDSDFTQMGGV